MVIFAIHHPQNVEGKVVVITGGGGGLGRLISLRLADLGAVIVSLDINEEGNLETQTYVLSLLYCTSLMIMFKNNNQVLFSQ